ncbi:MAG TPA: Chromate resistance protein ChrB [Mycobacterium sp.]|nr:Chromate resistance protein ChrB [Mycobacterium sp.]
MPRSATPKEWILLSYRLPREPSTPRSSVWRTLRRLGVAQLGDGLVALPADARSREALEWVAEEVIDNGGEATLWEGRPADQASHHAVVQKMTDAIRAEYTAVAAEARHGASRHAPSDRRRLAARLSRELRRIADRDYFAPPERDIADAAVTALTSDEPTTRARSRS